jgi:hypothetical protein
MRNDACDNHYDLEHVVLWVNLLRAKGLDSEAIRSEVDKWTLGDVTQVYVGSYARTMPKDLVRSIVERALDDERAIPRRVQADHKRLT